MVRKSIKDSVNWIASFVVIIGLFFGDASANKEGYYGRYIGKLSQLHHAVSGDVFAVDARTLHLRNFNYDGEGPAAYFYAGNTKTPGLGGFRLRDERGTTNVLPRYRNKHITITLPEGKTLQNIQWFSVWCDEFSVNFGDVKIPRNLDFPKPQKINGLSGIHGVSSEPIVIVDAQTLLIPSFSYDGEAPDAKFWVGRGFKPSPQGIRIPDENGKELPLRRYDRKTIVLTLPGDLTIFDIGHFGVWCEAFTVDFGHVQIPRGLNIPPSLKMLGVSPQSKLNCEVLWDDFAYEVRWAVAGDSIVLQLVARLENNEYMSFGLSGDKSRSRMVGGDVVVAWVDKNTLKGYAQDYYLDAKSQCSGGRGSCPDDNIVQGTDSVRLLNAALVNGYSIVTFQRSLKAQDELDKPVYTNETQPIIWAIGPLNSRKEVSYHSLANRGDIFIDFGRSPKWNCPTPESSSEQTESEETPSNNRETISDAKIQDSRSQVQNIGRRESRPKNQIPTPAPAPKTNAWEIPAIKCNEPEDGVFYAQMGPTGGKHGYSAITGHVGWGISWYINGLLIPEINVVRGRTYSFITEGGHDSEIPARYHPFYITDDPVGGYEHKTPEERANIQIFAGAVQNKRGEVRPTGLGRFCSWTPDPNQPPADEFSSFGAYQRTLRLICDPGNPGIIQWTVEKDTPDTVYYQCFSHRYLGWKINVHDSCEDEAASDPVPSIVKAPSGFVNSQREGDSDGSESINYETRVKPDFEFLKNMFEKNQTIGLNEFVSQDTIFKYRPEISFYNKNTQGVLNGEYSANTDEVTASKNPNVDQQVIEVLKSNSRIPPTVIYPLQPQFTQVEMLLPNIPQVPVSLENNLVKFNKGNQIPLYSVTEQPAEGENLQVFQNFQIIPVSGPKPIEGFLNHQIKIEPQKSEIASHFQEQSDNDFTKTYLLLRNQGEEKLKKHNQKLPVNRLPGPGFPNRLRKPQPLHAMTLQQRPFPPGVFRPGPPHSQPSRKPQKRPAALGVQKHSHHSQIKTSHSHHRLNVGQGLEDTKKQESQLVQQFKLQHQLHMKQQEPHFVQESRPSALFSSSVNQQTLKNIPFAHNTGFDPQSVQVEGGFKPILNTYSKPNANQIDRIDVEAEEDVDGKVGTIDLVDNDSQSLVRETDLKKSEDGLQENGDKDLFKDLKPQSFEPIFIPSFPDDSFKKHQEKHKKKPLLSLKHQFQYDSPQKKGQVYVKMRPNTNLIRRPLYPDNVVPPFKIQGGIPQFRNQQDDSEEEEEEDSEIDLNKVNNETLNRDVRAGNILEIIEMSEDNKTDSETASKEILTDEDINKSKVEADEVAMADERKDFYLPPKADQFRSYDGKVVKADQAPALPESSPLADVMKLPQFVPFRGAIPPLTQPVNTKNLPQLRSSKLARHDILPPSEVPQTKVYQLKTGESFLKDSLNSQEGQITQERKRRSPDHIPGHEGHDHHDHHDHFHHNSSSANASNLLLIAFLNVTFFLIQRHVSS